MSLQGVVTAHPEKPDEFVFNLPAFVVTRDECATLTDEELGNLLTTNVGAFYHGPKMDSELLQRKG